MRLTDHVLDRCEDTMRHTRHTILCWLRSTKHHQAWHSVEFVQGGKSRSRDGFGSAKAKEGQFLPGRRKGKAVAEVDALTSVYLTRDQGGWSTSLLMTRTTVSACMSVREMPARLLSFYCLESKPFGLLNSHDGLSLF
jgi:hypothetical protein